MAQKQSLTQLMKEANLDISGLAKESGLSRTTVHRAVRGDVQAKVNTTTADAIAKAVGLDVGEISWPGGLSNRGRPAQSGGASARRPG